MIDYEKLKIAHELADKYAKEKDYTITFSILMNRASEEFPVKYKLYLHENQILECLHIDDLISKLQSLIQPKQEYEANSELMNDFTKEELVMLKNLTRQHVNQFRENSDCIELMEKIQSLIDNYCEHESNGEMRLSYPGQWKCKKCGEFYK